MKLLHYLLSLLGIKSLINRPVVIKGYIEDHEQGWKEEGKQEKVSVPSTHDLGYCIDYAIRANLQKMSKNLKRASCEIGYKIVSQSRTTKNNFITHLIVYQVYTR